MEVASPPKRMTRARAAAKEAAASAKPTKVATATTKTSTSTANKSTRTTKANTATTATVASAARATSNKRKTRPDEEEEQEEEPPKKQTTMNKPPARARGRPKKVAPEPAAASLSEPETEPETETEGASTTKTRATRGRAKKTTAESTKPDPPKTTRTRTRKTVTEDNLTTASSEPAKKVPRRRTATNVKESQGTITTTCSTNPTPGLKSAVSRPASRVNGVTKKTVTFQEPEKENKVPTVAVKAKDKTAETATGMRAKPVRKPAAGGRTTRASAKSVTAGSEEKSQKSPLSPKKDGHNIPISRDADSDDELATLEKTPLKPLLKSPIKPAPRRTEPEPVRDEDEEAAQQSSESTTSAILNSPVRRIPPSPWKDSMKSPAKRVDAIPSLILSATKKQDSQSAQSPFKATMLQSPAKRAPMPIKVLQAPFGVEGSETKESPLKASLLQSPAKRPTSPVKVQSFDDPQPKLLFHAKSSPVKEEQVAEAIHQSIPQESPQEAPQDIPQEIVVQNNEDIAPEAVPAVALETPIAEAAAEADTEDETEVATEIVTEIVAEAIKETESETVVDEVPVAEQFDFASSIQLEFPGRLSAVLPRHADPALKEKPSPVEDATAGQEAPTETAQAPTLQPELPGKGGEPVDDAMEVDELESAEAAAPSPAKITPPQSPSKSPSKGANQQPWGVRGRDLDGECMSDSEDELAGSGKTISKFQEDVTSSFSALPATPTPAGARTPKNGLPSSAVKAASRAIRSVSRGTKIPFTPLAMQLGEWKATSPLKKSTVNQTPVAEPTPSDSEGNSLVETETFFTDEMRMRGEMELDLEAALLHDIDSAYPTKDDEDLAAETNEMSLLDFAGVNGMSEGTPHDDSISDASQEYGDENAVPIDPALLNSTTCGRNSIAHPPVTPVRHTTNKTFHTVSKVPLKASDNSSPRPFSQRCASASKLPPQRSLGHSRTSTVTSFVPTKDSSEMDIDTKYGEEATENPPVTPAKSDVWSVIGTPARTPRRDLNPALLRGAVVFVDVHTSEGADASSVFIELLGQMGARCVKSWTWNPNNGTADPSGVEASSSKIGITHVVYKDGGKRTMEKVRQTNGVVQCVGVGWVLDCERENQWLDEAPYYIDTSLVPRGGRNRRKSMEPKALANLNGTLVTPMKNNAGAAGASAPPHECQTAPNHHAGGNRRRDSTLWMRSPEGVVDEDLDRAESQEYHQQQQSWEDMDMLTPVPQTPAPETIRQYAMSIDFTPETPAPNGGTATDYDYESCDSFNTYGGYNSTSAHDQFADQGREQLLMRTCPPKQQQRDLFAGAEDGQGDESVDDGILGAGPRANQSVLMRLMAARRKSLQFAPKVASPLRRGISYE